MTHRRRRRSVTHLLVLLAVVATAVVAVGPRPAARAAAEPSPPLSPDASATLSVEVVSLADDDDGDGTADVRSGEPAVFRVTVGCSSTDTPCENTVVDLSGFDAHAQHRPDQAACSNVVGVVTDTRMELASPFPAGATAECELVLDTRTWVTPDGSQVPLAATASADNADAVTDDDTTVIRSQATLWVDKRINGREPADSEPVLDEEFRYTIGVGVTREPLGGSGKVGEWLSNTYTVTDTLPVGAELVDATVPLDPGGDHSTITTSGTPATGITVTAEFDWGSFTNNPLRTGRAQDGRTIDQDTLHLTVVYPSATFAADDQVTNTAAVSGYPIGADRTPQNLLTDDDLLTHGFTAREVAGGLIKTHDELGRGNDVQVDEEFHWDLRISNRTNVPATFTITDDPFTSESDHVRMTLVRLIGLPAGVDSVVRYDTNLGTVGSVPVTTPDTVQIGPGGDIDLDNETEWVTGLTIDTEPPPNDSFVVAVHGSFDESMLPLVESDPDGRYEVTNCAELVVTHDDLTTDPDEGCRSIFVVDSSPFAKVRKRTVGGDRVQPGESVTFQLGLASGSEPDSGSPLNPVLLDVLPERMTYVAGSMTYNQQWLDTAGMSEPEFEVIDDFQSTGRQALRWTWPATEVIDPGTFPSASNNFVRFDAELAPGTPIGQLTNESFVGSSDGDGDTGECSPNIPRPDRFDVDGDGDTDESVCGQEAQVTVASAAAVSGQKRVRGDLDDRFMTPPDVGQVSGPGVPYSHRIDMMNTGNVGVTDLVVYDILPFVGDTGVSQSLQGPRGSAWAPQLAAPVEVVGAPVPVEVAYSTSGNPCRDEVYPDADNPDCVDDWTTTPPGDLAAVRALRFDLGDGVLAPAEGMMFEFELVVPEGSGDDVVDVEEVAWNSIAYTGVRADGCQTECDLPVVEPRKVGAEIPPASIAGRVTFDADGDGVAAPGEGLARVDVVVACIDVHGDRTTTTTTTAADGSYRFDGLLPGDCTVSVDETTVPGDLAGNSTIDPDEVVDAATDVALEAGEQHTGATFGYGSASIDVEKSTNGVDADETDLSTAPRVGVGEPVSWRFVVTNDGNADLADVAIVDDRVDVDIASCVGDRADDDDDGNIDLLLIGETVTCTTTGTAEPGTHANTASVRGTPVRTTTDPDTGAVVVDGPIPNLAVATDEDRSHHVGAGATIGDTVWLDADADGVFDDDERGLSGATVTLTAPDGSRQQATTDADGTYLFDALPAGEHRVTVDASTATNLPPEATGLVPSADPDGTDSADESTVSVGVDETNLDQDFGYRPLGSIAGSVFYDLDGDGRRQPGEQVPRGVRVVLTMPDGTTRTTAVDDGGAYRFDDLPPGDHAVEVVCSDSVGVCDLPATADPDSANDGATTVSLAAGEGVTGRDFGFRPPASPAIELTKTVNGSDADDAPVTVDAGDRLRWTFVISNPGDVALVDVELTDDRVGAVDCGDGEATIALLLPGSSVTCRARSTAASGPVTNTARVTATPATPDARGCPACVIGDPSTWPDERAVFARRTDLPAPSADDVARYVGRVDAGIELTKHVCAGCDPTGDDGWQDAVDVDPSATVTWRVVVTNTGAVSLGDVEITDEQVPGCAATLSALAPGESVTLTCTSTTLADDLTNAAAVSATPLDPSGRPARAGDGSPASPVGALDLATARVDDSDVPALAATGISPADTVAAGLAMVLGGVLLLASPRARRRARGGH